MKRAKEIVTHYTMSWRYLSTAGILLGSNTSSFQRVELPHGMSSMRVSDDTSSAKSDVVDSPEQMEIDLQSVLEPVRILHGPRPAPAPKLFYATRWRMITRKIVEKKH
jgi:hypothetical protein